MKAKLELLRVLSPNSLWELPNLLVNYFPKYDGCFFREPFFYGAHPGDNSQGYVLLYGRFFVTGEFFL